ncbi:hypothetical protein [Marinagarivorans cellulosilyticus]|uniref:hypothetical protein n=1 Tax=Marinagarivorans cellulosilyticus TaxID=2721545 RepID=UPI001F2AC793|nr:hypothetical protein [Marinagarivorans cellulosilyticus]
MLITVFVAAESENNAGMDYRLVDGVVIKADYQIGQSDNLSDSLSICIDWSSWDREEGFVVC